MILKYAKDIKTKDDIKLLLDMLKPFNSYIDTLIECSLNYELSCEKVSDQLCEIDKALCGFEKVDDTSLCNANMRMFSYWDYLKNEIDFNELLNNLKDNSSQLLINL